MDIEFRNLSLKANTIFREKKTILKNINGKFRAGELTGIIGCSGAGKTTLINILSGYRLLGHTGYLGVNGVFPRNERVLRKYSCYIRQEEIHQNFLTVGELMELVAKLKLDPNTTKEERNKLIDNILRELNMINDTTIIAAKLTSGAKKRLSIALELINNPSIFFLDEPTSGLDIVVAKHCMRMFWELAHSGNRTVVCTIHTPSSSMFQQLDLIYVLSEGRCVYQGTPAQLVPFMASLSLHCPILSNPADFVIEMIETNIERQEIMKNAIQNGRYSCQSSEKMELLFNDSIDVIENNNKTGMENRHRLLTSNWTQFRILLHKMIIQQYRDNVAIRALIFHHIMCTIIYSMLYVGVGNDAREAFSQTKFTVSIVVCLTYTWVLVPAIVLPNETKLLRKEHFNRWYNLIPYYLAWNLVKLPLMIVLNIPYIVISYIVFGLPLEFWRIFKFYVTSVLIGLVAESYGLILGSFMSVMHGALAGAAFMVPFLLLSAHAFDHPHLIPKISHHLMKLSFMRTGNISLMLIIFRDRPRMYCPDIFCPFDNTQRILEFIGIENDSLIVCLLILVANIIVLRLIAMLILRFRLRVR